MANLAYSASTPPRALIVDDEPLNRRFAQAVLASVGWNVLTAADGAAALGMLTPPPALVLMDMHMAGMSGVETVAAIRDGGGPAASVPILAYTTTRLKDPMVLRRNGFDGFVPKPCTPAELVRATGDWWPGDAAPTLDRLEAAFGEAPIRAMIAPFRALLVEALDLLDRGTAAGLAHRVAGVAGTLGFADAGKAWLAVSEGDSSPSGEAAARLESRRAIAAIDRRERD